MSELHLRVNSKIGQLHVKHLYDKSTITELKKHLSTVTSIPLGRIELLSGYPPKPLELRSNITLKEAKIRSGDTLTIKEKEGIMAAHHTMNMEENIAGGPLMRKVVPSDNSCLFTSIGFVLGGKIDLTCGNHMRQIIAEQVSQDEETFSEAILGKANPDYCRWIKKSESWGGAIELAVLSNFYGLEIAVIDTVNAVINRFGEDKNYSLRSFLIFDGIHYDPVFRETFETEGSIQTLFPTCNIDILKEAEELAQEANSSKQYTDVNRFTLTCLICKQLLVGQKEAQHHAKTTGHTNFGEVAS